RAPSAEGHSGVMFLHQLGEGAGLGPLEPWHAEEFAATVDRAREHLKPWIPFSHRVVDTDTARDFLQGFAEAHAADTRHNFGIWLDGRLVGGAMFVSFDAKLGLSELGVWLSPEAEGRGLITQASRCLIDWAIRERGMARVEWHVSP